MTEEVRNQIVGQFYSIIPTLLVFIAIGIIAGIGYKLLMKKISKMGKKDENEKKSENEKK